MIWKVVSKWYLAHSNAFERAGGAVTTIASPKPFFFIYLTHQIGHELPGDKNIP